MQEYDIIFLGETPFSLSVKKQTEKKLRVLLLRNTCFAGQFSTVQFPGVCFIPQPTEFTGIFGQVTTPRFRMDLLSDRESLSMLCREELREEDETFSRLSLASAQELDMVNRLIIDNFGFGFLRMFRENWRDILKNPGKFLGLNKVDISRRDTHFSRFLDGLNAFFAPGEQNPGYFSKYLLYSLVSKKAYIPEFLTEQTDATANSLGNTILEKLELKERWNLHFDSGKAVTAKMIISALPPHILTRCSIRHPFLADYTHSFREITFKNAIQPPEGMAAELLFLDNGNTCFVRNRKDSIALYMPAPLDIGPDPLTVATVVDDLCPHAGTLPELEINDHIYPYYTSRPKRSFREGKNIYFLKNYEYPQRGIDGEVLYQNRLVEFLWKSFL